MPHKRIPMDRDKKIALVAHDNKKRDLIEWARFNRDLLAHHEVFATGTTGKVLERELEIEVTKLQSGPLGGDQQIGARIVNGEIDFLIFFWDPLEPLPHDPDVKALLRMAVVWNIPIACNRVSVDFMQRSIRFECSIPEAARDAGPIHRQQLHVLQRWPGQRTGGPIPFDRDGASYRRWIHTGGSLERWECPPENSRRRMELCRAPGAEPATRPCAPELPGIRSAIRCGNSGSRCQDGSSHDLGTPR